MISLHSFFREGEENTEQIEEWQRGSKSQISAIPALGFVQSLETCSRSHAFQCVCNENSLLYRCRSARVRGSLESQELCYFSAPRRKANQAASGKSEGPPWRAPFFWAKFPSHETPCEIALGIIHCMEFKYLILFLDAEEVFFRYAKN